MSNPTPEPEFPPGLRLRNPQTGASFEVIEHTHAVRMRNLRTDAVSAIPQDMAREFERLPAELPEAPRAELPSEQAALSVRPCARNIHAALKRANLTVTGVRVTTGRRQCRVDLTATLDEYGPERAQEAEDAIRRLWNDHEARILVVKAEGLYWTLLISVASYWRTAPADVIDLCHAAAMRENEARTPAPVVTTTKLTPLGTRTEERMRAAAQGADGYLDRVRDIRVQSGKREAEHLHEQARLGLQRLVAAASNMPRALLMFAQSVERASVLLAQVFPQSHPNACDLCGLGVGERDHSGWHPYEPPSDATRYGRMLVRRLADAPARERVREAHREWRRAVFLAKHRAEFVPDTRTELERAGLTIVPFDQQGGNPDEWKQGEKHGHVVPNASAYSLPS